MITRVVSVFLTVHSPPMRHRLSRIMNITEDQIHEDMLRSGGVAL